MSDKIDKLYTLQKDDIPKTGAVLKDAFQHDPVWNKLFEGEPNIDQKLSSFFETPVRHCLKYGEVYAPSENIEGIAAWVSGELADMTFLRLIGSGALRSGMKIGVKFGKKMEYIFKQLKDDRNAYINGRSFYYLQIIGVAAEYQGQGFGGQLLRALIEKGDDGGIPIYLETETQNNVKMYEKFGFKIVKKIALPVINLPMWEMARELKT